ncbi:MAG: PD-(D/E)XK nuclease family protein, partial [Bacteroidetes bacterium]|nr:PD-(D/E)XK nuclease family protein [Bacteroidota bacterium]
VGDTKQSIYTFRHADWHIMKQVKETTVFPSAPPQVKELICNYRSYERIVDFNRTVFHDIVPKHFENKAPEESGLSNFIQEAEEKKRGKGYVEVSILESNNNILPERTKLLEVISDCRERGYDYSDIVILTPKNKDVIEVSSWLNTAGIPFISHSSLDIRSRRVTRDILTLLRFLDSPIDNMAFASFILSKTFMSILKGKSGSPDINEFHEFVMKARQKSESAPLYTFFRKQYPLLWHNYFEYLFSVVGYLPLYDLTTEILKRFELFTVMNEEEETLAKLLGVIKNYEDRGQNNLKDFLAFTEEENEDNLWDFVLSRGAAAVEVMTIHKAKGLGNRVVIVLLYDGKKMHSAQIIDEKEDGVRLLHVTSDKAEMLDELQDLYNAHRLKQDVDDLNKLYVAFTRAKEEMYIIDIRNESYPEPSKYLPQEGYEQTAKPEVEKKETAVINKAEKMFSAVSVVLDSISSEKLSIYERQRGDCIHSILSQIQYIDDNFEEMLDILIKKETGNKAIYDNIRQLKNTITAFLTVPEIKQWFNPRAGRIVLNEQEFVDEDGRLYRMDRIVIDTDRITVIDYKTGDDKTGYTEQLEKYASILRSCYKKKDISGILAFIDKRSTRIAV